MDQDTLDETSQATHDGVTSNGRRVQIKATFKDSLTFRTEPDYYLGLRLFREGGHEVIFNGPGQVIREAFGHRKGFGKALLSFPNSRLRGLSKKVREEDRIPRRRNSIRHLPPLKRCDLDFRSLVSVKPNICRIEQV